MVFDSRKIRWTAVLVLGLLAGGTPAWSAEPRAVEAPLLEGAVPWRRLAYECTKAVTALRLEVGIRETGEPFEGVLEATGAPLENCHPSGRGAAVLEMKRTPVRGVPGLAAPEAYTEMVWFDPAGGRTFQRLRWQKGETPWLKNYCWTKGGVSRQSVRPSGGSRKGAGGAFWRAPALSFYSFPRAAGESPPYADPAVVVFLVSAARRFAIGSTAAVPVFGKKQAHRMVLGFRRSPAVETAFQVRSPGGRRTVTRVTRPVTVSVSAEPAAGGGAPERFSLLGLHRRISVWVDPQEGLPVRIAGINDTVGELVFDLREAVLR